MKEYNNGQRPAKMYGGGMVMPRKAMQMGGLAQENREQQSPMTPNCRCYGYDDRPKGIWYGL